MLACMITPGAGEPGGAATVKRPARPRGYGSAERIRYGRIDFKGIKAVHVFDAVDSFAFVLAPPFAA